MAAILPITHHVDALPGDLRRIELSAQGGARSFADALIWEATVRRADGPDREELTFKTDDGAFDAVYHRPPKEEKAFPVVIWVGGAGDGLDGPARGLYPAMCERLRQKQVAGLRLSYRRPNDLAGCVLDVLLGVEFLRAEGAGPVALAGHSFGGAVVITAGAISPAVAAVVPLSSQTYGTQLAPHISPRPMLLVHGAEDEILPARCSERIYAAAREPKRLVLYPKARHGLDQVREELIELLAEWLPRQLSGDGRH